MAMADAIRLINGGGGLAILANPVGGGTGGGLTALVAVGLDGVEVRHPSHSPADVNRLRLLSDQLGLVPSGGSDWHGLSEGGRTIGMMQVPADWLERQDARPTARGSAPAP